MRDALSALKRLLPPSVLSFYHLFLAFAGAYLYGFPSRKLVVVGVTGTKGKSSTTEFLNAMFVQAGHKTAVLNSIRVKIGDTSKPNMMRMSMPGRFFIQKFLARARKEGCSVVILEMTSEGARQHRHRFIDLDGLIFTNLAPEHIESHGSYQAYADAKFSIGQSLLRSKKRPRTVVALATDKESGRYLTLPVENPIPFSLEGVAPWSASERGGHFTFRETTIPVHIAGEFSLLNALAAAHMAEALGVPVSAIQKGSDSLRGIPGRAQEVDAGQDFVVVVDYAHTPDSLEALYKAYDSRRKICVLGSMGGSRDGWNRPIKGEIAEKYCDEIILTNEDPCDDDPSLIIEQIAKGIKHKKPRIILDRREAIREAIMQAKTGDAVLITGKGTDPWMYVAGGKQIPWNEALFAREELERITSKTPDTIQ